MIDKITFLATIPDLQSAITISGAEGEGARVKIDIPDHEMPSVLRLMLLRGQVLKVTIEAEENG